MTATTDTRVVELAERTSSDLEVVQAPPGNALDVFHHPFAYARVAA
jgi:hypothetical protein